MNTSDQIRKELRSLADKNFELTQLLSEDSKLLEFAQEYQLWYTRAVKIVQALAPDRLAEFTSYYLPDSKRKGIDVSSYTILDYTQAVIPSNDIMTGKPRFDAKYIAAIRVNSQGNILVSLVSRIDSVLTDVTGRLFAEIQDSELKAAAALQKTNLRAAGALAGVVLERHLQQVARNHSIQIKKKEPTIADLNDPLRAADIYDTATWRRIQHLADLRNLCSHQKAKDPTPEQVTDLLQGVDKVIKTIF